MKIKLLTVLFLISNFAFCEEQWVQLYTPSISTQIIEFINSKTKGNWDTVQTISIKKLNDEYSNIYKGQFKFGKSNRMQCLKYGATCDPDSYRYTCSTITVKLVNGNLEVLNWDKSAC